jgi:hypothetical protein
MLLDGGLGLLHQVTKDLVEGGVVMDEEQVIIRIDDARGGRLQHGPQAFAQARLGVVVVQHEVVPGSVFSTAQLSLELAGFCQQFNSMLATLKPSQHFSRQAIFPTEHFFAGFHACLNPTVELLGATNSRKFFPNALELCLQSGVPGDGHNCFLAPAAGISRNHPNIFDASAGTPLGEVSRETNGT